MDFQYIFKQIPCIFHTYPRHTQHIFNTYHNAVLNLRCHEMRFPGGDCTSDIFLWEADRIWTCLASLTVIYSDWCALTHKVYQSQRPVFKSSTILLRSIRRPSNHCNLMGGFNPFIDTVTIVAQWLSVLMCINKTYTQIRQCQVQKWSLCSVHENPSLI